MKHFYFLMVYFSFGFSSFGQYQYLGADGFGRANSMVAVPTFSSVYHNPAGLGFLKESFIHASYFKTLPVQGFHTIGLAGNYANSLIDVGFSVDAFGDEYYKESRVGFVLAKRMDRVSIGAKFSYLGVSIHEMSSRNTFLGEVGMLVKPNKFLNLGLNVINVTNATLYAPLPTVVVLGVALNPSSKVCLSGQADYIPSGKAVFRFGLNYRLRPQFSLSMGANPELRAIHFGINLMLAKGGFSYAAASHPSIGMGHHVSFIYKAHERN